MLKSIDILIGLTVVMLGASMTVTVLTQFVTTVFNTRGRHLLQGLADLLQQIDPALERKIAERICGAVLLHPMVRDVHRRYGTVIHREEFTKLLMDLGSGQMPVHIKDWLDGDAAKQLETLLKDNGISDPKQTLEDVRTTALQLEMASPELAANVRQAKALMQQANSRLVAKINSWFDQTIDRVCDRFTFTTRGVTFACAFVVAFGVQLDAVGLINRLSVDAEFRNELVREAVAMGQTGDQQAEALGRLTGQDQRAVQSLLQLGVIDIPRSPTEWWRNWEKINVAGVLLSVFLLSLGAPFWYSALKNLLRLRGTMAVKDDSQRGERQTESPAPSVSGSRAAPTT